MTGLLIRRPDLLPSLAVGMPALFWGLFWIPVRMLNDGGITGSWTVFLIYAVALVVLLPLFYTHRRGIRAAGWGWLLTGLFTGGSFLLYANAFLHTEIVRVFFLFYISPIWAALLARFFLGERLTYSRLIAIALGLAGLIVILNIQEGWPVPRSAGDWMALCGGMVWALAALRLRQTTTTGAPEQALGFYFWGVLIGAGFFFLPLETQSAIPDFAALAGRTWGLLVLTAFFALAANLSLVWGARLLSPLRSSILLMMELISGTVAASILTDEPFGLREILGGGLIVSAAGLDLFYRQKAAAGPTASG